jgi:hypothetical protein
MLTQLSDTIFVDTSSVESVKETKVLVGPSYETMVVVKMKTNDSHTVTGTTLAEVMSKLSVSV